MRFGVKEQMQVALLVALFVALMAAWNARIAHADEPWVITNLDAGYTINADGSVDVVEDYRVDFGTLRVRGINRRVTAVSGADMHDIGLDVISVDDGQAPIRYERTDRSDALAKTILIAAGDPAKPLTGLQRFRFKYRLRGAVNAADPTDRFYWNIRGEEPFARVLAATISVSAPALETVTCDQLPLDFTAKPTPCKQLDAGKTGAKFVTTTELPGVVGLSVSVDLPKGAVSGAIVATTPTSGGGASGTDSSDLATETDGGFKPLPSAITLLVGLLGLVWLERSWRSAEQNPARRVALNWLGVAFVLMVGDAFALLSGLDVVESTWVIASMAVSLLPIVTGLVVAMIYTGRARVLDKMFSGEDLVVHWTYAPEEWRAYAEAEYQNRRKLASFNVKMATMVAALVLAVIFVMSRSEDDSGLLLVIGMAVSASIVVAVGTLNFLYVWTGDPRRGKPRDAWIALSGVYLFGALTTWKRNVSLVSELAQVGLTGGAFLGNMLDNVSLVETPNLKLRFDYSYWTRQIKSSASVEVPVPAGQANAARAVLAFFAGQAQQTPFGPPAQGTPRMGTVPQ